MFKIRKNTQYLAVAILLAGCVGAAWSQTIFVADFEGSTTEGWGLQQDPFGATSWQFNWADNGPSLPGDECNMLYSLGPPDGPANYYGIYTTVDLVASGKSGSYKQLQLTYDLKANWTVRDFYWIVWVNFTDSTQEQFNYIPQYTFAQANVWEAQGPFLYNISELNQSKTVQSVFVKVMAPIVGLPSCSLSLDNVVIRAVPLTGPDNCIEARQAGYGIDSDLNGDCKVDFKDFAIIAGQWLNCIVPNDPSCTQPWN